MGAGLPEQFVSLLRMNIAGLPRKEKSLVTASCRESLASDDVVADTRALLGSRGGGGRRNVLITEEAVDPSEGD